MTTIATSTPEKLLDAAARLMSERGVGNVTMAEIVRAAGQRNPSAIQYHFGTRDDVLCALLARQTPELRASRLRLLERARSSPSPRDAAEAMVRPLMEMVRMGWRERAFVMISVDLRSQMSRLSPRVQAALTDHGGDEARVLLRARCPTIPDNVWAERTAILYPAIGLAGADRARLLNTGGTPSLDFEEFIQTLLDIMVGALTAPISSRTGVT